MSVERVVLTWVQEEDSVRDPTIQHDHRFLQQQAKPTGEHEDVDAVWDGVKIEGPLYYELQVQ